MSSTAKKSGRKTGFIVGVVLMVLSALIFTLILRSHQKSQALEKNGVTVTGTVTGIVSYQVER